MKEPKAFAGMYYFKMMPLYAIGGQRQQAGFAHVL